MIKSYTIKRFISLTLAVVILNNILTPSIALALTSGPARPESASFEPVDTTDMVNMLSGDLAYNVPLLEVPGPEGGYPLSLSYHAGIMPEQEASWVGLGWTLNPGSIDRTVSGFPDDFKGQENVVRDYWSGGNRSTTSVGLTVGLTGVLSADFGVIVAHDSMLGTGVGGWAGLSAQYSFSLSPSVGASVGGSLGISLDPFGGVSPYMSVGVGLAVGNFGEGNHLTGSLGLNISTNFKSVAAGANAGISLYSSDGQKDGKRSNHSLLGASVSSSGGSVNLSVGGVGYSGVENITAGKIQTETRSWGLSIPLGFGSISLKRSYTRYWSDETNAVATFGTLYYPLTREDAYGANKEYDTYYLTDVNDPNYSLTDVNKNDPMKSTGGSLPDYDTYSVMGQGISGYIRPYGYQMEVFGKGRSVATSAHTNRDNIVYTETPGEPYYDEYGNWQTPSVTTATSYVNNPSKLHFRFMNEFTNRYVQQELSANSTYKLNFDKSPQYGINDGTYGYDPGSERLGSSRDIEYFTNTEINDGSASLKGFIDVQAKGFDRKLNPDGSTILKNSGDKDSRIGGFMITNESGVTYHYALPVYAYSETTISRNLNPPTNSSQYNTQTRNNPYATCWLLTAVTGPDYVDINNNGKVDQGDWGYWIDFEYGKWASQYMWSTPFSGENIDLDHNFAYQSKGKKELYYLDAIVTGSHTAIFSKKMRADSKSWTETLDNPIRPAAELRLESVTLFNNKDLGLSIEQIRQQSAGYSNMLTNGNNTGFNVIDVGDMSSLPQLSAKVLRKIQLNYNYSLCPLTENSFDEAGEMYSASNTRNWWSFPKQGKLTLLSVSMYGKQGQETVPPTEFEYEIPEEQIKRSSNISFISLKTTDQSVYLFNDPDNVFKEGELIQFSMNGTNFYGLIKNAANGTLEVKFPQWPNTTTLKGVGKIAMRTTKNPAYSKGSYDMWNMYKADFQDYKDANNRFNENLSRLPSKASAKSVDVWSLRRVHQALGMTTDIVYESDTYSNVALYKNASIVIDGVESLGNSQIKINAKKYFGVDLRDFIKTGDKVRMILSGDITEYYPGNYDEQPYEVNVGVSLSSGEAPSLLVTSVDEGSITVTDENFYKEVFVYRSGTNYYGGNLSAGGIGNNYGGGIRVKQVINKEPITGVTLQTTYNYDIPGSNGLTSGTTSYEPLGLDAVPLRGGAEDAKYQNILNKNFSKLLGLAREVPAPGVMYEYVGVSISRQADGQETKFLGSSQYQFEVFNESMINVKKQASTSTSYMDVANITLQDFSSRIGALKRMIQFDDQGNKVAETINNYLHDKHPTSSAAANGATYLDDLDKYQRQGVIIERIAEGRYNDSKSRYTMTSKIDVPAVSTGSTVIDYRTGLRSSNSVEGFDFYSGQPIATSSKDSYGNHSMTLVTPAYYLYPKMGLKSMNLSNANMLTQSAQQITYKLDDFNATEGIISASATIWSDQTSMLNDNEQVVNTKNAVSGKTLSIWRPYQNFQWMPQSRSQGITQAKDFKPYFTILNRTASSPFGGGEQMSEWTKTSEIKLYNKYSNPLEAVDLTGIYAATKMGYNQSKVIATVSNAKYAEFSYTGLEDGVLSGKVLYGGMNLGNATVSMAASHSGVSSALLNAGQTGLSYTVNTNQLKAGRAYTAAVWVKADDNLNKATLYYRVNGGTLNTATVNTTKKIGSWVLVSLQIPGSQIAANATLEVGCINNGTGAAYFDDFRFKPLNTIMASYVYDNFSGELTYILDNNNLYSKFEYDAEGRLTKVYGETFAYGVKLISENQYNYAQSTRAKWQMTGSTRCQQVDNLNTGLTEAEQVDQNALSSTYNSKRWVVTGSSSNCAISTDYCTGPDKKYVNGVCQTGRRENVRTEPNPYGTGYRCYYRYAWTDGTYSQEYWEVNANSCPITIR
ncbi:hypothetical protein KHS38_18890 [Mucilaginibacter sp. Bleaf8]|uniref:hypothetical protein n=1 Tax=Mucilaginibacter sp. Bleaf8 TaxID=2834430 RepID=UPI001BD1A9ED|nr:hypothetical protein [Mucilaginibacter sp. Bleaf8]MBS7566479.1 hypothetical protein [Mucilaginibacter sp. Bleaf8]